MTTEMEPMSYQSRMHAFEEILDSSSTLRVVDIPQLRALALQGIPEHPVWMRSRIWRLLLGALPPEKDKWEDMARKSRTRYYDVAAQLLEPIQTAPPPEYPLNARDKLLDTIAKDVDRTQPRIPFFRRTIDPLQAWPKPHPATNPPPESTDTSSDGPPKTDLADALFDRLAVVQRVVRFGNSAPPPIPRTPEIRVMVDENTETPGNDAADKHPEVKSDENAENSNSAANKDAADSDSDDDDDQPLAFKAGGRSSLGLSIDPPSPHLSPQLAPYQPHTLTPTLQLNGQIDLDDPPESKTHAHVLLRILYVYSLLHPHHPYTQGLNELLAPLYYAVFEGRSTGLRSYGLGMGREEMVGEAAIRAAGEVVAQADSLAPPTKSPKPTEPEDDEDDPTQHIEADTFWLFVELMGELGGVVGDPGDWSLPPVASGSEEGVRGVMTRLSERLRWADARLWEDMVKKSLDPKLPYFSYRWIACLLAQDLPLTALLPVWDTLFAQNPSTPETNPKIEWLINICVALLIGVRDRLVRAGNKRGGVGLWGEEEEEDDDVPLSMIQSASGRSNSPVPNGGGPLGMNEAFVQGMLLLQRYPLETVGLEWVINKAFELSAKRAAGFGIIESNNAGGAGWGGINVNGAWDVAAAMRNRVAGWRTAPAAPATQGAASTTPVPDVLVSPPAPSLASVGGKIRQYTETFKQSDTAASLSKASTNWSLAVMSAWNRSGQQQQHAQDAPSSGEAEKVPAPPPKDGRVHGRGHNRSDSWAGWGAAAVAAAKLRAAAMTGARAADVPESVAEEDPEELEQVNRRDSVQWDPRDRGRQSPRSQSLSPTALTRIAASTQPLVPQQRTATYPHPPTPRSAREPPSDYEPPPRPAVFKNPRDSWLPTPKQADTHSNTSQEEDVPSNVPPAPSPNQRFTMTLPGWSAMPPSSPSASSHTTKKTTGPKPLLLGKSRQTTSNTTSRLRMSRQSSVSSSTGSHREWELMAALSPRSDSGSMAGRPDSGSFAARSRRSIGTGSMPASAAGSLAPSEDEAVVVGLGLMRGSSDQDSPPNPASGASSSRFSPPVIVPRASSRPTSTELKRTSSPLSMSIGTGGSFSAADTESAATSPRGWQLADGPVTAEPAQVRKWELTDGPSPASVEISESRDKLVPSDSTTVRKFELTDGPAPGRASTTSALGLPVVHDSPDPSPTVPPAPRKWELTDNPVPRREPNPPRTMTADSDAAESPVLAPGETRTKAWPKRSSSNRPTNLTLRAKTRTSSSSIGDAKTPAGDGLRTPHVEENLVTPTSATTLPYLRTPTPGSADTPLPQVEERTPRRKKQGQASPVQNRRSKAMRGAARSQDVMSEEDGVKADAEDGEEYEDLLSAYETETDDTSHGAGHAR